MEILVEHGTTLIWIGAFFGLLMAYGIGANDVANAMGTSVGSGALTLKQALFIAMIFEFAGAYLAGGEVTSTIRKGIIDAGAFTVHPEYLVFGMMAALLAAGSWLLLASVMGWPVSTTHSIIGSIIGFTLVSVGSHAVEWGKVSGIVGSWVITPAIAGFISYMLVRSVERLVLDTDKPFLAAKRYVPFYMALAAFVMALVTMLKGLKHVGLDIDTGTGYLLAIASSVIVYLVGRYFVNRIPYDPNADIDYHYTNVEKIFGMLMVVTACCMAFAHGSNDVANAIGPLAAVVGVVEAQGEIAKKAVLAWWVLPLGGFGIVLGLATLGKRVIGTIGTKITHLTPSRGFAAELAAASTVVIASGTGLPISTTQTLIGAVVGVGIARGIAALNLKVIAGIIVSWVVTLPAGAVLAIMFFFMLKGMFLG